MAKKVIRLTEADLERIVKKVLSEQLKTGVRKGEKIGTVSNTEKLNVELPKKSFESGKYKFNSLSPEAKKAINQSIAKVALFINENPNTEVTISIEVGESAVTNYDNEGATKKKVDPGYLSQKRGETIKEFLTDQFKNFVDSGKIKTAPIIPDAKTNIGLGTQKYTYERGKDDPKDPKYLEDQYIKFIVDLKSTTTEDVYDEDCLVGFVVDVSYKKESSTEFKCRGGHRCDDARFAVYLNDTELGIADLNNKKDGGDREARFVVGEAQWDEISQKMEQDGKDTITLWTKCLSDNCHSSVQEVKLTNEGASFEWNKCVNPLATRGDKSRNILAVLDKCGKVLNADIATDGDIIKNSDKQNNVLQSAYVDVINSKGVTLNYDKDIKNIISGYSTLKISNSSINGNNLILMVTHEDEKSKRISTTVIGDNKKTTTILPPNKPLKVIIPIEEIKIPSKNIKNAEEQLKQTIQKYEGKRNPILYKIKDTNLYYSRSQVPLKKVGRLKRDILIKPNTLFKIIPR